MKIEQALLKKGGRIVSVRIDSTVEQAAHILRKENIGAVVVKDVCGSEGDTVVGMFSERDIVRALVDQGASALQTSVWSLMSKSVISCSPRDDVENALALMDRHHIRHLPVLEDQNLIGVVSIRDLASMIIGASAQSAQANPPGERPAAQ